MIKIPSLMLKNGSKSSISCSELDFNEKQQASTLKKVESDLESNYQDQQMIIEIQKISEQQIEQKMSLNSDEYAIKSRNQQKGIDNYQRFKILEKKFDIDSEDDQEDFPQQRKPSIQRRRPSQNIFFTQILESKVFHRDVIEAAKTEACLQDSLNTYNITDSTPQINHSPSKFVSSVPHPSIFTADVFFLTGGQWAPQKICVKNTELRFSDFAMQLRGLSKLKVFRQDPHQKLFKIKMTINDHDYLIGVEANQERTNMTEFKLFANIIKAKLEMNGVNIGEGSDLKGKIMKKSQYLAKWDQRRIQIKDQELNSYKEGKCTFKIKKGTIKQLWTRFDFIKYLLIIKINHSLKKTEFAIPVSNYSLFTNENWLFSFYKLLKAN